MYEDFIGKKVIVRGTDAGVFIGTLVEVNETAVRLNNARNVWYWEGATCVMQLAEDGIKSGKVSQEVPTLLLMNICQVIPMSEIAVLSFERIPYWKC